MIRQDLKNLKEGFAASCDQARLRSIFAEKVCQNNGKELEFLGEGTHFRAFRVRLAAGIDVVIKRALPAFAGGPGAPGRRAWQRALASLGPLVGDCPLLAPSFLLDGAYGGGRAEDELGLVMPYGDEPVGKAAAHWQPLERSKAAMVARLAALGLAVEDHLQLRCRGGVPFIIDLSDLRRTGSGSL